MANRGSENLNNLFKTTQLRSNGGPGGTWGLPGPRAPPIFYAAASLKVGERCTQSLGWTLQLVILPSDGPALFSILLFARLTIIILLLSNFPLLQAWSVFKLLFF